MTNDDGEKVRDEKPHALDYGRPAANRDRWDPLWILMLLGAIVVIAFVFGRVGFR